MKSATEFDYSVGKQIDMFSIYKTTANTSIVNALECPQYLSAQIAHQVLWHHPLLILQRVFQCQFSVFFNELSERWAFEVTLRSK